MIDLLSIFFFNLDLQPHCKWPEGNFLPSKTILYKSNVAYTHEHTNKP